MPGSERSDDRPVGPLALLALGINGIVGVGIFFAPADIAARAPGLTSVFVFVATALCLAPVALVFARLGSRFDEDGGPVVFAQAAFGERAAFVVGWISYVSALSSLAAVLAGMTAASAPLVGVHSGGALRATAAVLLTVLAAIAASGMAVSARAWTTLTGLKLVPLLLLCAAFAASTPSSAPLAPVETPAIRSLLAAGLTAVFALQGFEIVPVLAGRTRSSARVVPFATLASLGFAGVLYAVLQYAAVTALPGLATSGAPLADAASVLSGPRLTGLIVAGTSVSALGIALGMTVVTPHYLAALARAGARGFGFEDVDPRGVPRRALLVTWLLVLALLQAGDRGQLFALAGVAVLTQYVVTAASLAELSRRRERGLRPADAWPAVPATIVGVAFVAGATWREAAMAVVAVAVGGLLRATSRRLRQA